MKFDFLIIAGGKKTSFKFLKQCLKISSQVVAVDGGAKQLKNIKADLFVGDGDSFKFKPRARKTVWLNKNKDLSDLEFTLKYLPPKGKKLLISAHQDSEGRMDHVLSNLLMPLYYSQLYLADESNFIFAFKGSCKFKVKTNALFSLISPFESKISITGADYNLKPTKLKNITNSTSNTARANKVVAVKATRPTLMLINSPFSKISIL